MRALPRGAAGTSGQPLLQQSGDANVRKHILDYVIRDGAADRAVLQQMTPLRSLPGSAPALVCLLSMIVVAHQIRVRSSREARGVARGGLYRGQERSAEPGGVSDRCRGATGSADRRVGSTAADVLSLLWPSRATLGEARRSIIPMG